MESHERIVGEMEKNDRDGDDTISVKDFQISNIHNEVLEYNMVLQYALTRPDPEKWIAELKQEKDSLPLTKHQNWQSFVENNSKMSKPF